MALARLKLLKSASFLNEKESDWDNELKLVLEMASRVASIYTGRNLEMQTYQDELYTGNDTTRLYLNEWPVSNIDSVKLWDGSSEYDLEDAGYYLLVNKRYIQYPKLGQEANATYSKWESTYENGIKITYSAGYGTASWQSKPINEPFDVEADLEHAVCSLAQIMWMEGKKGGARRGVSTSSVGIEGLTVEKFINGMPRDVERILNDYRRLNL